MDRNPVKLAFAFILSLSVVSLLPGPRVQQPSAKPLLARAWATPPVIPESPLAARSETPQDRPSTQAWRPGGGLDDQDTLNSATSSTSDSTPAEWTRVFTWVRWSTSTRMESSGSTTSVISSHHRWSSGCRGYLSVILGTAVTMRCKPPGARVFERRCDRLHRNKGPAGTANRRNATSSPDEYSTRRATFRRTSW